jgi:hypothetical protein
MVGGRMAEGRIGIGPPPGQKRRTINDQITRPRQPHPQACPHQEHKHHFAPWCPSGPQPLGLLRLAGHARPAVSPLRQPAGSRQRRPGAQPVMHLLVRQTPQRAQQRQKQERVLAIDARRTARTSGQRRRTLPLGELDGELTQGEQL